MVKIERILVGLDGSSRAAGVLAAAVQLAQSAGARVWLYRAVGLPSELPLQALSRSPTDLEPLLVEHAERDLAALAATVPPPVLAGTRTSLAVPWQGVCEAASEARADLIVVGSHGYGGLDRLLGTTATKIVNHADRSVLVVKEPGP